ncbi:MAG: RtcB family protein [archaeon]
MEDNPINPDQIDEVCWQIDKKEGMHVPARVYASEKLLQFMKRDKTLQQVKNVAYLPGIYRHAIVMPDGHQGYGFPIGGVAALDAETGGISPGGIGYDINCLARGTSVLDEFGASRPIEQVGRGSVDTVMQCGDTLLKSRLSTSMVLSFDWERKEYSPHQVPFSMSKKKDRRMLRITTESGTQITASEDHPLLTPHGMVEAGEISTHDIANAFFVGIPYEPQECRIIVKSLNADRQAVAHLERQGLLPLSLDNEKLPILARVIGYLLGDGLVYHSREKSFVCAYGQKADLDRMAKDISRIGFSAKVYARDRQHHIETEYGPRSFRSQTHELRVSSKGFALLLEALGMPAGRKTDQDYDVPGWIKGSKGWIKRLFLAGLFGAELSAPDTSSGTCFYCPTLCMSKNEEFKDGGRQFLISVMRLLDELGVSVQAITEREAGENKRGKTVQLRLLIGNDDRNLIALYSKIGYEFCEKRSRRAVIAVQYLKLKRRTLKVRVDSIRIIKELKARGLTCKEIVECLNDVNDRFVERHFYEDRPARISQGFPRFRDFVKEKEKSIQLSGLLFDPVENVEEIDYVGDVYDLNVMDTHTFVANGLVVSNCGVRLLQTNLDRETVHTKIRPLVSLIFKKCPAGLGGSNIRIEYDQLDEVLRDGAKWAVKNGYGTEEDLDRCEEYGCMPQAEPSFVSARAKKRGRTQLATLGSGNHFIEVQYVDEIFDEEAAKAFGITKVGQVTVMIHCGSRGLGHQTCSDYLREMEQKYPELVKDLPDRELIYAPAGTDVADRYLGAMAAAANFAWCNRHILGHYVRESFKELFPDADLHTVYDVAHNIAKVEHHEIDGKKVKVYVHRKGATRAFGPGMEEVPEAYREIGQPVIIPGSMGTSSWVMVGTSKGMDETFGSTAHGAGRMMSRSRAIREFNGSELVKELGEQDIFVKGASEKGLAEEAPAAYKDVDEVIDTIHKAGIAKKVARLKPMGVMKG